MRPSFYTVTSLFWRLPSRGLVNAFGVFQTYYESELLPNNSPSQISWIGVVQGLLLMEVGVFSGPAFDAGYFTHLLAAGSVLVVLGHMMTSLCHRYWQLMLAQGLMVGLGLGCFFVPSVSILPRYFSNKTTTGALANGLSAAGSSVGESLISDMTR
jgi:MFS family permease